MVKRVLAFVGLVTIWVLLVPGCLADRRTLELVGTGDAGDAGSLVDAPPGACSPTKQTGCISSQKCTLTDAGGLSCIPNGSRQTRASCTPKPDNCARGNICTPGASVGMGMCRQFCERKEDCTQAPPTGQPTNEAVCAFEYPGTPYRVCSTPCNPVPTRGPSGCPSGVACLYGNLGGVFITDCNRTAGFGVDGDPCSVAEDCADGFLCGSSFCRAYCRYGFDADCTGILPGYTCATGSGGSGFSICCPPSGNC